MIVTLVWTMCRDVADPCVGRIDFVTYPGLVTSPSPPDEVMSTVEADMWTAAVRDIMKLSIFLLSDLKVCVPSLFHFNVVV